MKVRANAKNLLALDVEREMVLHPLFVVPADVPKHVAARLPRATGRDSKAVASTAVHPICEPVLVPDGIVALLRAHLPRLAPHEA